MGSLSITTSHDGLNMMAVDKYLNLLLVFPIIHADS